MPIKLSELAAKTRKLERDYDGEALVFRYFPARFTPDLAARLQDAQDAPRPTLALCEGLAEVLEGWDIVGDDGAPVPVTVEWLRKMPMSLLTLLSEAMGEDMRPKAASATASPATSSLTG